MSWQNPTAYIDNNPQSSQLWRQALQAATQFNEGVVSPGDLKVSQTTVASLNLNIASGSAVILGSEEANQGSYFGVNVGTDTVTLAAGGGTDRWDLIMAEVQDPTFSGSPWNHNPATDQLIYSVVESNVSSGTTQPPTNVSAIPLAIVHVPAGASSITDANITDLRSLVSAPRQAGTVATQGTSSSSISGSTSTAQAWPTWFSSQVSIPSWATHMRITASWCQLQPKSNGASGTGPKITVSVVVGGISTQTSLIDATWLPFNASEIDVRQLGMVADTINVQSIAGTLASIVPTAVGQVTPGTALGSLFMDTSSMMIVNYEFLAQAV